MVSIDAYEQATRRGLVRRKGPLAIAAHYDINAGYVLIDLSTGISVAFRPSAVQGLETASADDLDVIEISPSGLGLHFPKVDADLYLPTLLQGTLGSRQWTKSRISKHKSSSEPKTPVQTA